MGVCSSKQAAGTKGASPVPPEQEKAAGVVGAAAAEDSVARAESQEYPRTPTSPQRPSETDNDGTPQVRLHA